MSGRRPGTKRRVGARMSSAGRGASTAIRKDDLAKHLDELNAGGVARYFASSPFETRQRQHQTS